MPYINLDSINLDSIEKYSGAYTFFSSLIMAIITLAYVILTHTLVKEQKTTREMLNAPLISAKLQPKEGNIWIIELIIDNIGKGPAYDIKLSCEPEFEILHGKKISDLGFFKNGIPYLDTRQTLKIPLIYTIDSPDTLKLSFDLNITCYNKENKLIPHSIPLSFLQFENLSQMGPFPLKSISESLSAIKQDISQINNKITGNSCVDITIDDERSYQ